MQTYHVLVADDEPEIGEAIEIYLRAENMKVFQAANGVEALRILEEQEIHMLILDVMMPLLDGIKTTHRIREQRHIPILMLSAKSEDTDKILGLNVGADDYMTKPFNPMELVARVKSQLRRYTHFGNYQASENEIRVGGLVLNQASKTVSVEGEEVRLTATEYRILELLMQHKGRVFSIEEIYEKVWREPYFQAENTVAVHVRRIREKIEINPKEPEYLKVVWGIGYKMEK
ncbi:MULTISPECIES: response regulator transcription factor [Paenibacillus]|uniref:response regulator transcription factor n=1 Tax=Paenibacillus TaxID=44249 RepID=UPI0022B88801|nr:response regulator transcription factor [Paenibacillus caseinilyticus]MCZ8520686.1 response regulator transcription factor [Paenibacillus caseinilyticus]